MRVASKCGPKRHQKHQKQTMKRIDRKMALGRIESSCPSGPMASAALSRRWASQPWLHDTPQCAVAQAGHSQPRTAPRPQSSHPCVFHILLYIIRVHHARSARFRPLLWLVACTVATNSRRAGPLQPPPRRQRTCRSRRCPQDDEVGGEDEKEGLVGKEDPSFDGGHIVGKGGTGRHWHGRRLCYGVRAGLYAQQEPIFSLPCAVLRYKADWVCFKPVFAWRPGSLLDERENSEMEV